MKNIDKFIEQIKEKCNIVKDIDYHKCGRHYIIHIYFKLDILIKYLFKHNRYISRIPVNRFYNDYFLTYKELLTGLNEIIKKLNDLEAFYEGKVS